MKHKYLIYNGIYIQGYFYHFTTKMNYYKLINCREVICHGFDSSGGCLSKLKFQRVNYSQEKNLEMCGVITFF
jgi:hypothetical protein